MAQFDLKKATIFVRDGYGANAGPLGMLVNNGASGLVNNVGGYIAGTTTMIVDGFTGVVPTGSAFTMTGDVTIYKVTAHTETLGATTSITFTPGLVNPATDDEVITVSGYGVGATVMAVDGVTGAVANGDTFLMAGDPNVYTISAHTETLGNTTSITFAPGLVIRTTDDEAVTIQPHSVELRLVEGTLTFVEKQARVYVKNRGILDTVRNGDDDPVDVRTDFMWEFIRSQSGKPPTIDEAFKQIGGASAWISTDPDQCAPYSVDIEINYNPDCAGIYTEQTFLPMFRWEELSHDAKQGTVALTGKCNVKQASSVRTAAA